MAKKKNKKNNNAVEMEKSAAGMPSNISNEVFGVPENKTTTIEPQKKEAPSYFERLGKDLGIATRNTGFGVGGAEMSGAKPTEQQIQNDVDIVNDISAKTGMDITSPYAIRNLPVDKEEVDKYLEDPANYKAGEEPKREITETFEKPSEEPMEVKSTNKLGEEVEAEEVTPEGETSGLGNLFGLGGTLGHIFGSNGPDKKLEEAPKEANLDFSDYIDNYYGPKNAADYLKSLWADGKYGKAIGNVLGNLMGKLGTINVAGAQGQGRDYTSDWENYTNNYQKALAERNQKAFDQNLDISKQLRTNDVARNEMLKTLENYKKIGGKLTDEDFQNIRKAMTATGNGSQKDYYLASILGEISSDPKFKEAAKEASGQVAELFGNIAQFGAATMKPLNYIFGGGWK